MREVVSNLYMSLDGYAGDADDSLSWVTDGLGEQQVAYGVEFIRSLDALILGRVTYEIMASYWPSVPVSDVRAPKGLDFEGRRPWTELDLGDAESDRVVRKRRSGTAYRTPGESPPASQPSSETTPRDA